MERRRSAIRTAVVWDAVEQSAGRSAPALPDPRPLQRRRSRWRHRRAGGPDRRARPPGHRRRPQSRRPGLARAPCRRGRRHVTVRGVLGDAAPSSTSCGPAAPTSSCATDVLEVVDEPAQRPCRRRSCPVEPAVGLSRAGGPAVRGGVRPGAGRPPGRGPRPARADGDGGRRCRGGSTRPSSRRCSPAPASPSPRCAACACSPTTSAAPSSTPSPVLPRSCRRSRRRSPTRPDFMALATQLHLLARARLTDVARDARRMSRDDTGCTVLHVDMDAFFASVAIRDRPELQGLPVIIGGGDRGVVLSATYAARASSASTRGCRSTRARRLCPQAVIVRPDYDEMSAVRRQPSWRRSAASPRRSSRCRWTRRSSTSAGRCGGSRRRPRSASTCGPGSPTSSGSPARSGSPRPPSWPSSPRGAPSPTACSSSPRDEVTAFLHPLRRRGAVGGRREDGRAAAPARPAHRRRPGPHLGRHPAARAGAGARHPAARDGLGRRRPAGDRQRRLRRARAQHRRRRDVRPRHRRPRSSSTASCCGCRPRSAPGCGRPGCAGAPSPSRSGSPTSPRSPGPAPCATTPT